MTKNLNHVRFMLSLLYFHLSVCLSVRASVHPSVHRCATRHESFWRRSWFGWDSIGACQLAVGTKTNHYQWLINVYYHFPANELDMWLQLPQRPQPWQRPQPHGPTSRNAYTDECMVYTYYAWRRFNFKTPLLTWWGVWQIYWLKKC